VLAAVAVAIAVIALIAPTGCANAVGRTRDRTVRLAVLPFRLLTSDSGDRYLAEGITEEVTSSSGKPQRTPRHRS
jgi:TolB-like protein